MKYQKYYYILLFLSLSIFNIKADVIKDINLIISYKLNGTAAFVSLDSLQQNEKYIYFAFDFNEHSKAMPESSDTAYFSINSDFELNIPNKDKVEYGFSKKNWNDIKSNEDLDINWQRLKFKYKEKNYGDRNYYYKVKRIDDKMNTLLIRIPTNGRKEGYITVSNDYALPAFGK